MTKKKKTYSLLLWITFALKPAPRDNLYSWLVFERVSNNQRETEGIARPVTGIYQLVGQSFPTGKTHSLSLADRVTYINSRSECFEFHSHSLMKINEENRRVGSISHCFPEVIQNPSSPSERLSWYKEVGVPFPKICF